LNISINKLVIILILTAFYNAHSQPKYKNLGVNIDAEGAFINMVNHENRFSNASSFDEYGWPETDFDYLMMDSRPAREWADGIDDPEEYRIDYSGVYKCSFKGYADITIWGSGASILNKNYNSAQNTTFFEINIPGPFEKGDGIVGLGFQNTRRSEKGVTNSGISDLKIYRPDYDLDTKKIFTDEYINLCKSANFACYRYYTVQNIWEGEPLFPEKKEWKDRKTPMDASQVPMVNTNGKNEAWCYEYIIELSNILKKDIWICIHISADSNYVRELAKMLKSDLDPSINIYIENSNEVWSPTQLTHGPYNQAQAEAYSIGFNENYARRTVELSNIFAEVFGSDKINKRIRVILSGQQAYAGRSDLHLDYINKNIGEPRDYIYATSTTLYFGTDNSNGNIVAINDGMIKQIDAQINDYELNTNRMKHIDKAKSYNLIGGVTSYEGGPHYPAGGSLNNLDNGILSHRTEKMKEILIKNYGEGWFDIGGGLAMQFTLSGGYSRYGCWGLTDDFKKPDRNYKMAAIRELIGEWVDENESEVAKVDGRVKLNNTTNFDSVKIDFIVKDNSKTFSTFSIISGDYQIELDKGIYDIVYSKNGYDSRVYKGFELYDDTTLTDIILVSKIELFKVTGNVKLEDNNVHDSIAIIFADSDSLYTQSVLSLSSGEYSIELKKDMYFITYQKKGYITEKFDFVDLIENIRLEDVELKRNYKSVQLENGIEIYPNPANEFIYLKGKNINITAIYNFIGREILIDNAWQLSNIEQSNKVVDISSLPKGIYYIRISTNAKFFNYKFIKK